MRALVWSPAFVRAFQRMLRRRPELRARAERTVQQLEDDAFHPSLRTHKLKGDLEGTWACTVDYEYRILFQFVSNLDTDDEEILLLTVGTHDEVY